MYRNLYYQSHRILYGIGSHFLYKQNHILKRNYIITIYDVYYLLLLLSIKYIYCFLINFRGKRIISFGKKYYKSLRTFGLYFLINKTNPIKIECTIKRLVKRKHVMDSLILRKIRMFIGDPRLSKL